MTEEQPDGCSHCGIPLAIKNGKFHSNRHCPAHTGFCKPKQEPTQPNDCREAFEEWAKSRILTRCVGEGCNCGRYLHHSTAKAWEGWQAAWKPMRESGFVERLVEALTPSGATKGAYIGEFKFPFVFWFAGEEQCKIATVPWTTVKEIMAAIMERATSKTEGDQP